MSSTRANNERNKFDYYVTPQWMVDEFLDAYLERYPLAKDAAILDCCAGGDVVNLMPYPEALAARGFTNVATMDIREDSLAAIKGNYLETPKLAHWDLIITNPPFTESVDITRKAIEEANNVVMLQRLNWIGSDWRREFWRKNPPKHVFAHNKRASFTPDGRKDSIEYAHYVFSKDHKGDGKYTLVV